MGVEKNEEVSYPTPSPRTIILRREHLESYGLLGIVKVLRGDDEFKPKQAGLRGHRPTEAFSSWRDSLTKMDCQS